VVLKEKTLLLNKIKIKIITINKIIIIY